MTRFTPPVEVDISMTIIDDHFEIAVSLRNPTDDSITFRTMTGKLFNVSMETKDGEYLWSPPTGSTMAVTYWELDPNTTITKRYTVPNKSIAETRRKELREKLEQISGYDHDYYKLISSNEEKDLEPYVNTDLDEIIHIEITIPTKDGYYMNVTRKYDLRTRPEHQLEDNIPKETLEGVNRL